MVNDMKMVVIILIIGEIYQGKGGKEWKFYLMPTKVD